MNLVKNCAFRGLELLVVVILIVDFSLRSHDKSKCLIIKLISLVDAMLILSGFKRLLQDREIKKSLILLLGVVIHRVNFPKTDLLIEACCSDDNLTWNHFRVDLSRVDIGGVHQWLSHQEPIVILSVVQVIANILIFLMKLPNLGRAVARCSDKIVVISGPVHVVNEIVMTTHDNLFFAAFVLDVEDSNYGPTRLLSACNGKVFSHIRELKLESTLLLRIQLELQLVGQQCFEVKELLPRFQSLVILQGELLNNVALIWLWAINIKRVEANFSFPRRP